MQFFFFIIYLFFNILNPINIQISVPNQVENNAPEGLIGKSMANKKKKAILLDEIEFFKYLFTYIANAVQSKNNPIKPVSGNDFHKNIMRMRRAPRVGI